MHPLPRVCTGNTRDRASWREPAAGRQRACGFTLVELLVALSIMAVLAGLAWRGMDGMMRARDGTQRSVEGTARLNTVLAQWQQDLGALHDSGVVPALAFDGQSLRLTRLHGDGVMLVVWSLRGTTWMRWAAAPVTRSAELQETWLRSQQLLGNEAAQVRLLDDIGQWQVYFYRGNAWTNAQSTGDRVPGPTRQEVVPAPPAPVGSAPAPDAAGAPAAPASAPVADASRPREALPDGVRLVVALPAGTLTRDLALGPVSP